MTPDVNVLVAASRSDHPHHRQAADWLHAARESAATRGAGLTLLPMVAAGFVRIVTSARVFSTPTSIAEAFGFVRALLETPGVTMATLGDEWPGLAAISAEHGIVGAALSYAWIAAAVLHQHEHLVTFDRDFLRLLTGRHLTVLATFA